MSKTPHRKHPQNPKHAAPAQNKVSDPAPYQITLAEDSDSDTYQPVATSSQAPPSGSTLGGLTKLQSNLAAKLTGSRFRVLNEELYTTTSEESFKRFQANPELFSDYHVGFREQTNGWDEVRQENKDKKGKKEEKKEKKGGVEWEAGANVNVNGNPVNWIIEFIRRSASDSGPISPLTIADFGCGDAAIALALTSKKKKKKYLQEYIVHSLDMVTPQPPSPLNSIITACNIAKTPLRDKSVDIGVYR
ncbi:hypothetical protein TL16_g01916 [Triparma laevis f. inornata]|uniref:Ribosomal RNA-processing protein 8 n=1 Tax=Triparma laevis f. inornata TaxID=1714386 RepID=A0A9W7DUH7_9STRA|nr:hypothetical protein TL16_g01916 [Triparma laevis f. inornata]